MKRKSFISLCLSALLLVMFALWTILAKTVDVDAIGPLGSSVGLSTLNSSVHSFFGVHMDLYTVTDVLGLVPIAIACFYAILGLLQWIKRKHIFKIDKGILLLGVFYIAVIAVYILFENLTINYRPVLIDGVLEISYPSSTTILAISVMLSAVVDLNLRIKLTLLRILLSVIFSIFCAFMVIGRLVSGVHWCSDIIGGALISSALVLAYYSVNNYLLHRQ